MLLKSSCRTTDLEADASETEMLLRVKMERRRGPHNSSINKLRAEMEIHV